METEQAQGCRPQPAPQRTAALETSPASLEAPAEQIQHKALCGGCSFFTPCSYSPLSSGLCWWCLLFIRTCSHLPQCTLLAVPGFCLAEVH